MTFTRWAILAGVVALASCAAPPPPPPPPPAPPQALTPGEQCLAALDRLGVRYELAPIPASAHGCAVDNPVRVAAAEVTWNPSGVVGCAFGLRLDLFTREVVEPAALRYFGKRLAALRQFGAYSCRRTALGKPSQHAFGNAIDLGAFELEDGTVISVEEDWWGKGTKRAFLHDVAQRACAYFSMVLTPNSNLDHFNHFHLDAGPYHECGA